MVLGRRHCRLRHLDQAVGASTRSLLKGPSFLPLSLRRIWMGERLDVDHGYPLRLISPNRAGVLNTKMAGRIEVLS